MPAIHELTNVRRACLRRALRGAARAWLAASCVIALACNAKSASTPAPERQRATDVGAPDDEPIGYASGAWWQDDGLNSLLLNASQIVISHAGAKPAAGPVPLMLPSRSKHEALRIARSLRGALRSDASKFAELAMRYSDEPVSAALGGSLGNFFALAMPPEIVDALAQTEVGAVSRIVETEQGYHLLRRHTPSLPSQLAFAHLVVKYTGAPGFRRADRPLTDHTRDQARALAQRAAALAREAPERFTALVQEYSEAEDALRDGDMACGHVTSRSSASFCCSKSPPASPSAASPA
jgi:hypothetical protein